MSLTPLQTSPLRGYGVHTNLKVADESFLPLPNPPLAKGRELNFLISALSKGGLTGVRIYVRLVSGKCYI